MVVSKVRGKAFSGCCSGRVVVSCGALRLVVVDVVTLKNTVKFSGEKNTCCVVGHLSR